VLGLSKHVKLRNTRTHGGHGRFHPPAGCRPRPADELHLHRLLP
jgi:hypothetical protein